MENYYDEAFQFPDNVFENCPPPTIILDPPDETDQIIPNIFINSQNLQSNSDSVSDGLFSQFQHLHRQHQQQPEIQLKENSNQNDNEIKPEPIKSELQETSNHQQQHQQQHHTSNSCDKNGVQNSNSLRRNYYKCKNCPFISISSENLKKHEKNDCATVNSHQNYREMNKLKCPGCENIHYERMSLEMHFKIDHQVLENEIQLLLDDVCQKKTTDTIADGNEIQEEPKKSRIYLKNVEVLKNPLPPITLFPERNCNQSDNEIHNISEDSICTLGDHDQTLDNNLTFIDLVSSCNHRNITPPSTPITSQKITQQPSQQQQTKISIKSVDVLREPSLNMNQHQQLQHHSHLDPIGGINENFNCSSPPVSNEKTYYDLDTGFMNNFQENADSLLQQPIVTNEMNNSVEEMSRRAKIYIKNVDILKEPIFVPPPSNFSDILNVNDDLRLNLLNIDHQRGTPFIPVPPPSQPPPPTPLLAPSQTLSLPSLNNTISSSLSSSSQFSFENRIAHQRTTDYSLNSHPRSKIYVKKIEILKEPCLLPNLPSSTFQEFPPPAKRLMTSSLHLRTVDELNLMNTNEVQNLITPILAQQNYVTDNNSQEETLINASSENSKNSDELGIMIIDSDYRGEDISTNLDYDHHSSNINCNYDVTNHNFDSNSASCSILLNNQKNTRNFDLNTPQRPEIIDDDDNDDGEHNQHETVAAGEAEEEEGDILFVCAQDIVNQNASVTVEADKIEEGLEKQDEEFQTNFLNKENRNCSEEIEKQKQNPEVVEIFDDFEKRKDENGELQPNDDIDGTDIENVINLIEENKNDSEQTLDSEIRRKAKRGRPFGARQTGITKMKKVYGIFLSEAQFFKCDQTNCALRFKKSETLKIHKMCHMSNDNSLQQKQCPKCKKTNFSSWNTLHTHLWRYHQIDMELYSCDLCNFKTPALSLLLNTHKKIHSEERNFKCEQCGKAFKNNKQLKNHRRLHRNTITTAGVIHKCEKCDSTYAHAKSLKDHICKNDNFTCSQCGKLMSSKSSYKLHLLTHNDKDSTEIRHKCNDCEYKTNDYNALRRHRMVHSQNAKYICKFCDYKCIQSNLYQRHLLQKHPDVAFEVLFKCSVCSFTTINQANYKVHIAKHDNVQQSSFVDNNNCSTRNETFESMNNFENHSINQLNSSILQETKNDNARNKIKVKSDLILTDPTKFCTVSNNNLANLDEGIT